MQSSTVEKERLQELEVVGHLVSTVKEQREVKAAEQRFRAGPQPKGWCYPQMVPLLISVNLI